MRLYTARQRVQFISALQRRDDMAVATVVGLLTQAAGHPGIVAIDQVEAGHVVRLMRIEPGGHQDQLWMKLLQPRQPVSLDRLAEDLAVAASGQRRIDHIRGAAVVA